MSSLYCTNCRSYYSLETQTAICPHEELQRPQSLNQYGWKMPEDIRSQIDSLYRENDIDGLRVYFCSPNPLIRVYAGQKFEALKLAAKILARVPQYESDSQSDNPN